MITVDKLKDLQDKLCAMLDEFGAANDISFKTLKMKYDPSGCSCSVSFEGKATDGNVDEIEIDRYAHDHFGIDKAYGKTIYVDNQAMTICGFDKKARKYKVKVRDKDGKLYRVAYDLLAQLWEI